MDQINIKYLLVGVGDAIFSISSDISNASVQKRKYANKKVGSQQTTNENDARDKFRNQV